MNTLLQNNSNIIGSSEAVANLTEKQHARILLVSDSHGKKITLLNIVKNFGAECDALVLCGDSAYDLADLLEQAWNHEEIQNCIPPVLAFVQGNGDPASVPLSYEIGKENQNVDSNHKNLVFIPTHQIITANHTNIYITHGHLEGIDWSFENLGLNMQLQNCRLGFYGHSHIAGQFYEKDFTFVNPGSCSRPRGGQPNGFAIVTVEKNFCDSAFLKIEYPLSDNPKYSQYTPNLIW